MLDWLTRPADWLVQMMFATLMLAAFLALIVFWLNTA